VDIGLAGAYVGLKMGQRPIEAGLNTPAYLLNSMTSTEAAELARQRNLEVWPLDRYALERGDLRGLLLGFAALTESQIRQGVVGLTRALE
jgi:DNA-binding transcriptional MocR family regulator